MFAKRIGAMISIVAALMSSPVLADSMLRCGNKLVHVGETKFQVEARCGAPTHREVVATSTDRHPNIEEQWVYDRGPRHFLKILTFSGGRLVRIESGDKP